MQPITTLATIDIPVAQYVNIAVERIISGETDPLETYLTIAKMGDIADKVKKNKQVRDAIISQIERRGDSNAVTTAECKVEIAEVGVKYSYSECGDTALARLYDEREELDLKIKARENMLRYIAPRTTLVDEETGELMTLFPAAKSSTTSPKITFKK